MSTNSFTRKKKYFCLGKDQICFYEVKTLNDMDCQKLRNALARNDWLWYHNRGITRQDALNHLLYIDEYSTFIVPVKQPVKRIDVENLLVDDMDPSLLKTLSRFYEVKTFNDEDCNKLRKSLAGKRYVSYLSETGIIRRDALNHLPHLDENSTFIIPLKHVPVLGTDTMKTDTQFNKNRFSEDGRHCSPPGGGISASSNEFCRYSTTISQIYPGSSTDALGLLTKPSQRVTRPCECDSFTQGWIGAAYRCSEYASGGVKSIDTLLSEGSLGGPRDSPRTTLIFPTALNALENRNSVGFRSAHLNESCLEFLVAPTLVGTQRKKYRRVEQKRKVSLLPLYGLLTLVSIQAEKRKISLDPPSFIDFTSKGVGNRFTKPNSHSSNCFCFESPAEKLCSNGDSICLKSSPLSVLALSLRKCLKARFSLHKTLRTTPENQDLYPFSVQSKGFGSKAYHNLMDSFSELQCSGLTSSLVDALSFYFPFIYIATWQAYYPLTVLRDVMELAYEEYTRRIIHLWDEHAKQIEAERYWSPEAIQNTMNFIMNFGFPNTKGASNKFVSGQGSDADEEKDVGHYMEGSYPYWSSIPWLIRADVLLAYPQLSEHQQFSIMRSILDEYQSISNISAMEQTEFDQWWWRSDYPVSATFLFAGMPEIDAVIPPSCLIQSFGNSFTAFNEIPDSTGVKEYEMKNGVDALKKAMSRFKKGGELRISSGGVAYYHLRKFYYEQYRKCCSHR